MVLFSESHSIPPKGFSGESPVWLPYLSVSRHFNHTMNQYVRFGIGVKPLYRVGTADFLNLVSCQPCLEKSTKTLEDGLVMSFSPTTDDDDVLPSDSQ